MQLAVEGKILATDEEGYLANLDDWTPEVAVAMASEDNCDLQESLGSDQFSA